MKRPAHGDEPAGGQRSRTPVTVRRAPVVGLLCLVLATGCATTPARTSDGSGHDDADVVFATMMVPHHEQAVAMARMAAGRSERADVTAMARQVGAEQLPEIVQMQELLSGWGAPAAPTTMGMSGMAGMMTDQQMHDLSAASGPAFDHLFLQMMIKHHGGGVVMATSELSDGENADARQLAQNISDSQQAQTTVMIQMLTDRTS